MNPPTVLASRLAATSVGMVSALGLDAASSCAAIRARVARIEAQPFQTRIWDPIFGAAVPEIPGKPGSDRLISLLEAAIQDCMGQMPPATRLGTTLPLLVAAGDSSRPDFKPDLPTRLLSEMRLRLGLPFGPDSQVLPGGAAAVFRLIERARHLLQRPETPSCLVVAVDSYWNDEELGWLEANNRLKTEENPDGVIPGEAAAAVLLSRAPIPGAWLEVGGVGLVEEPSFRDPGKPNLGDGLTLAIRNALAESGRALHELDFRVVGLTGERHLFHELAVATPRLLRQRKVDWELWSPAEKLGDVGAALPLCQMVVAAMAFRKGYAPGRSALVVASGPGAARGAVVVFA